MAKKKYTPEATVDLLYNQLMSDYKGDAQVEAERQRQKSAEKKASANSTNSSTSVQNTLQSPSAVSRGASAVGNIYKAPKRKYTTGGTVHGYTTARSFAKDQTTKPKTSGTRGIGSATQEAFERGLSSRSLKENVGQRSSLNNKESRIKESDLNDFSRNRSHNQAKILDKKQAYVQAQRYENDLKKQRAEYDRLREEHPTSEWLKEEGWGALTGYNSTLASTVDWLLPDVITPKAVQNALDYYKKEDEKQQKKVEEVRGGDPLRTIGGNLGVNIVQNVPAMLYAPLTAAGTITTTAGTLLNPETLSQTGNVITRALYSVARETGNNPMFWETFLRTAGPTYDKEIESGADPVRATLSALTNGLLNAQIEIGGGIEKFDPTETFLQALRRSGEEEGLEEIQQYAVEGLTNKALGSNTAKWFSTKRGEDAVINPIDMAENAAYGALVGGLMGGGRAGVATLSRSLANAEYNRAFPDSKAHTQDLVEQALMQAREGQKSSEAEILASNIQNMMEQGEEVPTVLVRQLHNEVLRAQAENERDFSERKTEGYQQAVSEGRANTVETQDTEEESRVFRSVADEKAQTYYDTAMDKMGENASERSARAISKLMVGVHTNQDIDTILIDKNARNAVEEMTGINLPIKNTEAREILETRGLTNLVANRDNMLQETHNVIRSNMRSREGAVFEKNYDNAVKTIGVANAPEIYESVFSRFKNAGMVKDSDFDSAYDRIVSPLVQDFGEDLGGRIATVFNRDFAHQAFDAGRQAYLADEAKASAKAKAVSAEYAGTVTYKHDTESRLSTRQKSFMTKFAERAKVGIEFYDGTQEGEDDSANGYYENGVIHININSTNKLITVTKHELTHHIKVTAPEMYRKLEDFVIKKWYNNDPDAFDERVLEYQRKWNYSVEEAYEEIIANASEAFFTDRGTIDDTIKFSKKLGHTIHDGIRTLLDTFLDIQDTDRLGDRGYGEFLKELNILKDAQRMWLEALNESVERGKNNTAEATEADTEVRFSKKDDQDYLDAVNRGDMKTAQRMVDEYAKKAGYDVKAYHGTSNFGFTKFSTRDNNGNRIKTENGRVFGDGFYFTDNKDVAERRYANVQSRSRLVDGEWVTEKTNRGVYNVYLNLGNNYVLDWNDTKGMSQRDFDRLLRDIWKDHNSLTIKNIRDGIDITSTVYVVEMTPENAEKYWDTAWSSSRIKSADPVTYDDNGNVIPLSERFNDKNDDIRYSKKDSDGNTITEAQAEYFKDSKVRDKDGNLLVMYHGSPNRFTIFDIGKARPGYYGRGFYFTNSRSQATQYGDPYTVYLDVKNPLIVGSKDITRSQLKKYIQAIADNEDYGIENYGYGATVDSVLNNVWGRDDFSMLQDLNATAVGDFAEAVKLFNDVNGTDYDGIVTDTETVVFRPEQIKETENKNPSKDPDIRFSMKADVEETRTMIAWHNINSGNINGVLELGGLAMPSFALRPSNMGFSGYGDISIIADKRSIDPKAGKSQMIFGGDAWTPMFPSVDIKIDSKVAENLRKRFYGIFGFKSSDELRKAFVGLELPALDVDNLADQIQRWGDPYSAYGRNDALRLAYVMNGMGVQMDIPMKKGDLRGYDKKFWELVDERIPEDVDLYDGNSMQYEPALREAMYEAYGREFDERFANLGKRHLPNPYKKELSFGEVDNILYSLRAYRKNGIPDVVDIQALEKSLGEKINEEDYRLWIDNLFEGIVEKRGIRNDKDLFTPSGSRRGFDALHYEYNLENIVKAMKSQSKQGNTSWLTSGSNVKGASLKSYNDIEFVRNDLGRIVPEKTEEVKALYDQFDEQVKTLANKVAKGDPFTGSEILADVLSHAKTEASIFSYLNREYSYLRTQDHLELKPLATDIYDLGQLANTLPMEYFEAKVYREFPLQEALAIVVPDTLDSKIVSRIKEHNDNVLTYEAGNDEDRLAKVNSIEGARFSKKETDTNAKTIEYQSTIRKLEKNVEGLKAQFKRTNKKPNPVEARRQAGRLIKRHASNMRIHEDVANTLTEIYEMYAKRGAKAFDDIYAIAERTAVEIVNNISEVHFEGQEEYNQIKDYLRDTDIVVSEEMKRNITDFNDFRKSHFGKLKLVNGERSNIDSVYEELSEMFPSQFTDEYVNPADQLNHIADVLDSYAPFYETLDGTSEEMQDYVVAVASDLMETAYNLQNKKTFADKKYDEKVKAVKKAREEALANKREALSKMRKRYEQREAKEKQERQEKREARRERKQESEARTRLLEVARRLSKIKSTEEFERLRDKLIGDLDLEAKSMTGKTRMKLEDLERWYMDQVENNDWFVRNEALEKKFERLRKTHISEMSLEDVQNLTDILLMLEHKIRNDKKLINSQYKKDVFTASHETSEGIKQSKGLKFKGLHKLDNVFVGQTLSPIRYMRRITGYDENNPLMIATRELENGQNKMLDYRMRALKSFERFSSLKFMSHLNGARAEEITVDATTMDMKPTTVKIIPAERIWFYLSSKNADNMRHIVNGGVRIPDAKLLKKGKRTEAYDEGTLVRFSKSQVQEIIDGMAAEEKAYADAVYNYFNNVAPEATNAVSEMLDGISIAKVRNYFPIHVDDSFLDVEAETIKRDGTLEGMGSHKERVQSSKPAYAEDVSDMLIKAIEADAKYVGLAIPIRNFSKIYGSSSLESARGEAQHLELAGQVENGHTAQGYNVPAGQEYGGEESASYRTRTGGYISVKDAIRKNWTSDALGYIDDFLGDLQFPQSKVGTVEKTLRSLTSNYAGAVLTLNASVALKQAASFPTAGAVLGWKPLIKSFGKMGKLDLEYADSVTPLLSYRAEGFNFREAGDIQNRAGRDNWFKRIMRMPAFNWIQEMDLLTTRKLFKASEIYVKDNFPNLAYRGEAYNEKVAEVFNKVITETQPNYTVMERPGHLRSDSTLERTLSMFKTQPYQNFNIVYDATGNYLAKRQAFKDSKTEANRQELKEASKSLGRAVTSQIAQLATFAVMTSLWALARGKDDRWRDEEGNLSFASYLKRLAHDMASGVASEFFLGSDIFTAIDSLISDSYYYGFSSVTDSSINDFFNTGIDMTKLLQQAWDYALSDDKESIDTYKIHKQLEKVVTEGGRFTGIPTGNLINLTNLIYRWACIAQDGKYVGEYEAMKMSFSADKYKKALLLEAYKNDKVAYKKIRQMMIEDGFKETTLDNYIKKNA